MHVRCMHARTSKMVEIAYKGGGTSLVPHVSTVSHINIAEHSISTAGFSTTNFAMFNGGLVAIVASFGEAVGCYCEKLAGWLIKTYWATTTWLRIEYRHAPNHYDFRGVTSG